MKFHVSLVATDATTADGSPLVRGGELELTPDQRDDPFNARLIADSQLISVSATDKAQRDAQAVLDKLDQPVPDSAPEPPMTPEPQGEVS